MRVALIGPVPPRLGGATPGGVATHQAHLAEGLAAARVYAPLLATNAAEQSARQSRVTFPLYCVAQGWPRLDTRLAPYAFSLARARNQGSRREILRNLLWYRRFLAAVEPDLIHVQHPLERCLYIRMIQQRERWRIPLVVTAHSLFGEHPDEVIDRLMAPNLRAADHVIAVSEHIAEQAVQLGATRERISVIRSGVDTERFQPRDKQAARRRLDIPQDRPLVLFVGNLEPRKQLDVLLRAMGCVRERSPDPLLLVVGTGASAGAMDQTVQLLRLTSDLDLTNTVRFVGSVDDEHLLDYYAAADVFALPSSSEAQGIVALEAMACGLPVVATAVGGLLGTIQDGETGFLVRSGDVAQLSERLIDVLGSRQRSEAIGAAARRAVEHEFAWPRAVEATIGVYREVLERRQRRVTSPGAQVPTGGSGRIQIGAESASAAQDRAADVAGTRSRPVERLIAIPLGDSSRAEVESALTRQFGTTAVTWLDRHHLRRNPFAAVWQLRQEQYGAAVLVAPDLHHARLRLTSLVLVMPRAKFQWRVDLHGNREAWSAASHLASNALPVLRHTLACGLALLLAEPLLDQLDRLIKPRDLQLGRPRRLLYLRSQLWLRLEGGGSVAHTAGVIGGLEEAGVEVWAVSSDRLPGVAAPTRVTPPEVWFDGWLRELEDLAFNVPFLIAALQAAWRTRPQAVYQRHTAFNCSGALLSRLLRLPLVLEFNSSELWKGRYWGGLRLARAAALVERINLRAADRIVVVSEVLRGQLVAAGVPSARILVNPNAVDPRRFRPDVDATRVRQRLGLDSAVVVGFSGTFGVWHGIPTLARALPLVLHARPDSRWLLVGAGPLQSEIERAITQHGIGDRVHRTGLVPHAEMPAYLAACDILVSPHGRQADGGEFFGSPTKLFEYMAMGRPIVASAVGQIAEVLLDERSALLVPPDDPEALCQAIVRLIDDDCLRARLGQAARQAAEGQHTWRQNAERLLAAMEPA